MKSGIIDASVDLQNTLTGCSWFHSCVTEGNDLCVYVNVMDCQIMLNIPTEFQGYNVKIGYASFLTCGQKYGKMNTVMLSFGMLNILEEMK